MSVRILLVSLFTATSLQLVGCEPPKSESATAKDGANAAAASPAPAGAPTAGAPDAAAIKEAETLFGQRCGPCHGPRGAGDGPASAGLTPKPANFSDPAWQKDRTDSHIEKVIAYGGAAAGRSPMMPANPDLADKPIVPALRAFIRTLAAH